MMAFFQNKVVWITGASSGIGEALAYTFARHNAKLILSARRAGELERVKMNCKLPDVQVLLLPMDVADYGNMELQVQQALAAFGQIDILVNNAGVSHWSKVKDLTMDVIKQVMNVNFMGGVALTKAVLPGMLSRKQGQIVIISSILGKIVTPKQAAYVASKHALQGFYDTLRAETSAEGVKVLLVCPGYVRTQVAMNSLDKTGKPINRNNQLIEKGLDPLYVSNLVLGAIQKGREEIIIAGAREKMAIQLKRFTPAIFSRFFSNKKAV